MAKILVENNLTAQVTPTYLTVAANAGTSVLNVKNISSFNASWGAQIGQTGEVQSEIVLLSTGTPSGTIGTLTANTKFDHPVDTPIFPVKYDQLVFSRSVTGTSGTATPLANGTIPIMVNGTTTFFDDTTSATGYAYQTWFYNSVTTGSSSVSSWITTSGLPFYSLGKMRQRVKDRLVSSGYISGISVDDGMIGDWLNEMLELTQSAAIDTDQDFLTGTTQIAYATGQELGTITATDFKQTKRVWFSDASGTYISTKMDSNTFSPNKTYSTTYPYHYFQGDSVIGRKPSDQGPGTLQINYYQLPTYLVNDSDVLPVSMQNYTKMFVDYAMAEALLKDQKTAESQMKMGEAMQMLATFKKEITPRDKSGPTYISIVEDVASDQELWLAHISNPSKLHSWKYHLT